MVGIAFGFVLYILTYAYISGSSAVMAQTVFKYSGVRFPANISVVIVSMLVGAIAWYSSLLVGRITTVLIIGKFVAFFAHVLRADWPYRSGKTHRQRGGGAAQFAVSAVHPDDAAVLYYLVWFSR